MRILVTGGAGFVGGQVVQRLVRGGNDVSIFDRVEPRGSGGTDAPEVFLGDIRDADEVVRVIAAVRPDVIVHLAAILTAEAVKDPGLAVSINCGGMVNVLEGAYKADVKRVVWASSASVFGGSDPVSGRIREDNPYTPRTVYAGTKVLCDMLANEYARQYELQSVGLRLAMMTGVAKDSGISGVIGRELIAKPLAGKKGVVPYGDDVPSWLWVDDAVRAFELAVVTRDVKSAFYNVGGDDRSLREAVGIVRGLLGGDVDIVLKPGRLGLEHQLDNNLIERDLGFTIEWPLERQLAHMLDVDEHRITPNDG